MTLELLPENELIPNSPKNSLPYLDRPSIVDSPRKLSMPIETSLFKQTLFNGWELVVKPEIVFDTWLAKQDWLNILIPRFGDSLPSAQFTAYSGRNLIFTTPGTIHMNQSEGEVILVMGKYHKFNVGLEGVISRTGLTEWEVEPLWLYREQFRRNNRVSLRTPLIVGVLPRNKKPHQSMAKMEILDISLGGARFRSHIYPANDLLVALPVLAGEPALIARGSTRHIQKVSGVYIFGVQWEPVTQKYERYTKWFEHQIVQEQARVSVEDLATLKRA